MPRYLSRGSEPSLLLVLAAVQFTHVLDFVIMMPLGPQFMKSFGIGPTQFGWMISSYTFSAAISGLVGAFFIDRFDRRATLLALYLGFILGTFLCAIAPSHQFFILARVVAGAFAGVLNAVTFAIIGELIPEKRRGAATGTVMSAFSVASIAGVPLGVALANYAGWHAPFMGLVVLSLLVWIAARLLLQPIRGHLSRASRSGFGIQAREVWLTLSEPNHLWAFSLMTGLMFGAFTVIPYISAYMVRNVGLTNSQLPWIYLAGGSCTLLTQRWVGRLADVHGKLKIFTILATISTLPTFLLTHLPSLPLGIALCFSTFFMIFMSGRFVPAMALITSSANPRRRGSFMSVNGSVQSMAAGLASTAGGWIIHEDSAGRIQSFGSVGFIAIGATFVCLWLARHLRSGAVAQSVSAPEEPLADSPVPS